MPTSAQIDAARNSIAQSLNSLKPISPEVVELALLSLIADNASGEGSSSTVNVTNAFALEVTAQSVEAGLQAVRDRLPSTIGTKTGALSFPVTLSSDGVFATAFGTASDTSASSDTANTGFLSLLKRLLNVKLPSALSSGGRFLTEAVIKTAPTNPAQFNAIAASAGSNIKNTAGSVYSLSCINQNASIRYIQLFNKASVPATNDVPIESFAVYGSGGQLILGQDYFTLNGLDFATGISWGISTTPNAYTAATASDTIFTARYL